MSINVNGVNLPDIPVVEGCSYAAIVCEDNSRYLLFLSNSQMLMFPKSVSGQYVDFLLDMATVAAQYESAGEAWTLMAEQSTSTYVPLGDLTAIGATSSALVWSNHDVATITWFDSNDDTNFTTGEIYFPSSVASEPRIEVQVERTKSYLIKDHPHIPALPDNAFHDEYQYGVIIKLNGSVTGLIVTKAPLGYAVLDDERTMIRTTVNGYEQYVLQGAWEVATPYPDALPMMWIQGKYTGELLWSNHDIIYEDSDEIYFKAQSSEITTETTVETLSFPAIPTEWLGTYPYAAIIDQTIDALAFGLHERSYHLIITPSNMYYVPPGSIPEYEHGTLIQSHNCGILYTYNETTDTWDFESEDTSGELGFIVGTYSITDGYSMSGAIHWNNHNILRVDVDETGNMIPTEEIYLSGTGVIEPPKEMVVDRIFIVSSAANLRRLTETTDKLTTDDMITGLSDYTPAADPTLQDITITESGTYTADDGYDGFGTVTVTEGAVTVITDSDDPVVTRTATSYTNNTITSIGSGAFAYSNLQSISCENVTTIDKYAFYNANSLSELNLPAVETMLGLFAFHGCAALTNITLPALVKLTTSAFSGNTTLVSVNFPLLEEVAGYAFFGCSALISVNIPVADAIWSDGFRNCTSLTKLDLPKVVDIYTSAFSGCSDLTTLILRSETRATISSTDVFTGTPIESGTGYIYVPSALIDSYKTATNWSTYAAQFRAIEDYPDICG